MKRIDLHAHTTASDGSLTPTELVQHAAALGLSAVAVTDHDTHAGIAEAMAAGADCGIEVVPGIELSVHYDSPSKGIQGIHILGYFIRPDAPALDRLLEWVVAERTRRNEWIASDLRAAGWPVYVEDLRARNPGAIIGRQHFAEKLVELGAARDRRDAFDRLIGEGQPFFHDRTYIPMDMAFATVRDAGGVAVFAHPFQYKLPEEELLVLTRMLTEAGIVGIECLYSGYSAEQTEYLQALASREGLCVTGGSDFHGAGKPHIALGSGTGDLMVPYALLETLRQRAGRQG